MNKYSPIGIFDSGIGGLTVADAVQQLLPDEQIIYFGDTAHLPYGDKAASSIRHYSTHITRFLIDQGCKIIVIACNTASSTAYDAVIDAAGNDALVLNVIDPVVSEVVNNKYQHIGIIGTRGTIASNVYADRIHSLNPEIKVSSLPTPLLVPMIEEGFIHDNISMHILDNYLNAESLKGIDVLIPGCTHYPLIIDDIRNYYKGLVDVPDTAAITAKSVESLLRQNDLVSDRKNDNHHFYVSDFTDSFEQSTLKFFHEKVHLEQLNVWE